MLNLQTKMTMLQRREAVLCPRIVRVWSSGVTCQMVSVNMVVMNRKIVQRGRYVL